jgi:hypothetical protein
MTGGLEDCPVVPRARAILIGAAAAAAAACGLTACGASSSGDAGRFTDCADVGRLTTVRDPARDQGGRIAGVPEEPQGDLVGVRLARGHGRLCAEFRARSRVRPAAGYLLVLRPQRSETPLVQLEATVFAAEAPGALLNAGEKGGAFRRIDATVGIKDDRLSIVVDRATFARLGVARVFDSFRFQARTAVVTKDGGHLTDCAPACS